MKYDFASAPNRRNTGSFKWDLMYKSGSDIPDSVIPFSVADMELENPPELLEGMSKYVADAVYGYTGPTKAYFDSVIKFLKKRHNWDIQKEWIVYTPGIVPALYQLVSTFSNPGEGVIIMRPVYYPFSTAVEQTGRKLVNVSLLEKDGVYTIDFDGLEKAAAAPDVTMMILCSPHNPVGRVWTKEELARVAEICIRNNVLIVSDEIHFDFVMKGYEHTILSMLSEEIADRVIVCTAPSKSFNLGGVQVSNIIIKNAEMRSKFMNYMKFNGFFSLSMFAFKACELVYENCNEWFDELLELLNENKKLVEDYIAENIPQLRVYPLEGTYLMWIDCRGLGLSTEELKKLMEEKAYLFFDDGTMFGPEGDGFERWNIACPKQKLVEALERLKSAISELKLS